MLVKNISGGNEKLIVDFLHMFNGLENSKVLTSGILNIIHGIWGKSFKKHIYFHFI